MFRAKQQKPAMRNNSDGTVTWKDKAAANKSAAPKESKKKKMRTSIMNTKTTLEGWRQYEGVLAPFEFESEQDKFEWVAENIIDMYQEARVVYEGLINTNELWHKMHETDPESIPNGGFPPNLAFLWKDEKTGRVEQLPVNDYLERLIEWADNLVTNETVFPEDEDVEFPSNFMTRYAKPLFKRLFRIYAIVWSNEVLHTPNPMGISQDQLSHMKVSFRHFLYFTFYWEMVKPQEMECIAEQVDAIRKKYDNDRKEYQRQMRAAAANDDDV